MPIEKVANLLVLILLIEMMVAVGLGVSIRDVAGVVTNFGLLARAGLANYILVPTITILLLQLFQAPPMVAIGFLLVAVCPAAPFAPSLTGLAKGNVHASVGLMVILAASSAILAPLLLSVLSPRVATGANMKIDTLKIVTTLLMTQLLPLGVGLLVCSKRPQLAEKTSKTRESAHRSSQPCCVCFDHRTSISDLGGNPHEGLCGNLYPRAPDSGGRLDFWWPAGSDSQGSGLDDGSA